jgi:hypothetical protein
MELEAEVDRLTSELERLRREAAEAVQSVHRQYRRDLVPLRQTVTRYRDRGGDRR